MRLCLMAALGLGFAGLALAGQEEAPPDEADAPCDIRADCGGGDTGLPAYYLEYWLVCNGSDDPIGPYGSEDEAFWWGQRLCAHGVYDVLRIEVE